MILYCIWRVRASLLQGVTYGTVLRNIGHPPVLRWKLGQPQRGLRQGRADCGAEKIILVGFQMVEEQRRCWLLDEPAKIFWALSRAT